MENARLELSASILEERFHGCILGLAIGDALGYPAEFMSLSQIHEEYGPRGVQDFKPSGFHPAGRFTDDTQMTIAVAEALIEAGHDDLDTLMGVKIAVEQTDGSRSHGTTTSF
jgi:ADP-ribosylglycohydrolase